jgi:hypothetical protein
MNTGPTLVWPAKGSTPLSTTFKASTLTIYWSSYDKHEVMKRTCITLRTGKFNKISAIFQLCHLLSDLIGEKSGQI